MGTAQILAMSVSPSYAQSTRDMINRLNRLENELDTLSRAVYRGESPPPGALSSGGGDPAMAADAQVRLQQLEIELRDVRGKIEEQNFEIRQLKNQLERALGDMELRLGDLEGGGKKLPVAGQDSGYSQSGSVEPVVDDEQPSDGSGEDFNWSAKEGNVSSGQLGTLTQSGSGGEIVSANDPAAAAYEDAFAKLKNGQYGAAESEFLDFIARNPDHILTSNAKYWLGETYYVRGEFAQAARVFAEGYKKYPKSSKAPDNLLKLGMALAGMGKTDDACVALGQLGKEYPNGATPVLRRAEQERTRLSCS